MLVRVKQEEGGFYTIRASNEDDEQELSFQLQINGESGHEGRGLGRQFQGWLQPLLQDTQSEDLTPPATASEWFQLKEEHSNNTYLIPHTWSQSKGDRKQHRHQQLVLCALLQSSRCGDDCAALLAWTFPCAFQAK